MSGPREAARRQIDINDSSKITVLLALEKYRVLWKMQNAHSMISVNVQKDYFPANKVTKFTQ